MKQVKYLVAGTWFGLVLSKSEAASWFRIQEMFMFESFHMYGIIISAIVVAAISLVIIKKADIKSRSGSQCDLEGKELTKGTVIGGILFGFGWALTGACPGPLFVQIGGGYWVTFITFAFALFGAWVYAVFREKLPH